AARPGERRPALRGARPRARGQGRAGAHAVGREVLRRLALAAAGHRLHDVVRGVGLGPVAQRGRYAHGSSPERPSEAVKKIRSPKLKPRRKPAGSPEPGPFWM